MSKGTVRYMKIRIIAEVRKKLLQKYSGRFFDVLGLLRLMK